MICGYCTIFHSIPEYLRRCTNFGNGKVSRRKCPKRREYRNYHSNSCFDFTLSRLFWCEKNAQKIHVKVCVARIEKSICKCTQGADIKKLFNNLNPKLIKRKKPKLRLREKT